MHDHELMRRYLGTHDQEAFRALVERHAGMVYGVALRRTTEHALAEEVAQIVFVQLARKARSLKYPGKVAGWLHRSAVLESAHLLRDRRRDAVKHQQLERELSVKHADRESLHLKEISEIIDEALHELSPKDREVILAKFYEGLTYREIALRQTRKEAATRKHGRRALEKLERLLCRKGLTVSTTTLGVSVNEVLSMNSPVGLVDAIEGRVANLAGGPGLALASSFGSFLGSSLGIVLVAGLATLIPITQGWGRRKNAILTSSHERPSASVLGARTASPTVPEGQVPSIETILAAHGTERISLLIPWLDAADHEAMTKMAEAIEPNISRYARESSFELFLSLYCHRGFALDPLSTLTLAERWRGVDNHLTGALRDENLFLWWSQVDAESAWTAARERSLKLAGSVIKGIQKQDPLLAERWVNSLTPEEANAVVSWKELYTALAKRDADQALQGAAELMDPVAQEESLKAVLGHIARTDPEQALARMQELDNVRPNLMESIVGSWLESDREEAWKAILKFKPGFGRLQMTRQAGMAWAKHAPEEAEAWAGSVNDAAMKRAAWIGLAVAFSKTDVPRARAAIDQLGGDLTDTGPNWIYVSQGSAGGVVGGKESLEAVVKAVAMGLANESFAEAFEFASTFNSSGRRHQLTYPLSQRWIREDPKGMAEFILEAQDPQTRSVLASFYAKEVADPVAALPWAKSLDPVARDSAVLQLFGRLGETNADAAIEALSEIEGSPAETQSRAVTAILGHSSRRTVAELEKVRAWIDEHPEREAFGEAYRELTGHMAWADVDRAAGLVETLEPGLLRQEAVAGVLGFLGNQSPMNHQTVLHWIQESKAEKTQQFWLEIMARDWLANDPETAKRVVPRTGLRQEVWERLLSRQQTNQPGKSS